MEQDLLKPKKKRPNPILIFVGIFYLVIGLLFTAVGGLAVAGLIAQGNNELLTQSAVMLAVMLVLGLVMIVAAIRGFRGKGSYVLGFVLLALGAYLLVSEIIDSSVSWTGVSAFVLGVLYMVGIKFGKRK